MDASGVIGTALFAYALMAAVAVAAAFLIRGIVMVLEAIQKKGQPAPAAVQVAVAEAPPPIDSTAHHVAAIAAAVFAAVGAHRLVYIGEVGRTPAWSTTGRVIHHTSHQPKRSPEA
jgi:hypothetical protein